MKPSAWRVFRPSTVLGRAEPGHRVGGTAFPARTRCIPSCPWAGRLSNCQLRQRNARLVVRTEETVVVVSADDSEPLEGGLPLPSRERLGQFELALHPDKTRLVEFGRFAEVDRRARGLGRPETFDFLSFTHYCTKTRSGRFGLGRKPAAKRMSRTLKRTAEVLRRRRQHEVARWLGRVVNGWLNYYAVPTSVHNHTSSKCRQRWLRAPATTESGIPDTAPFRSSTAPVYECSCFASGRLTRRSRLTVRKGLLRPVDAANLLARPGAGVDDRVD